MQAMSFLVSTLFDLYIMVVMLRVWLQLSRADFYNPFSQFVVKATQPVVAPLRRIIPPWGNLDLATVMLTYVLCVGKFLALQLIAGGSANVLSPELFIIGLIAMIKAAGGLLFWVLIIRAILSWVSQGQNPIEYVMLQLTDPLINPIRRVIPPMGGLDLSVLVLFIALQFANFMIGDLLSPYFGNLWFVL